MNATLLQWLFLTLSSPFWLAFLRRSWGAALAAARSRGGTSNPHQSVLARCQEARRKRELVSVWEQDTPAKPLNTLWYLGRRDAAEPRHADAFEGMKRTRPQRQLPWRGGYGRRSSWLG